MESVVTVKEIEPQIALVTMQDRVSKNTFSKEFVSGLIDAFESFRSNSTYKVVILTGYDTYFASGGTQESLLDIYDRKLNFTDANIYSLPLECKIPVIAAMQGHGIGGGFALGMFADFVVLGRESVYTTNFMRYGFTPGMGSTFIISKKLGIALAEELLMGANNYRGA
jgi:polyketide biosynthesis enoyl-CoA hydratase PksI